MTKSPVTQKGCGKMCCLVCNEVCEEHNAYCLKHSRSPHYICSEEVLCPSCTRHDKVMSISTNVEKSKELTSKSPLQNKSQSSRLTSPRIEETSLDVCDTKLGVEDKVKSSRAGLDSKDSRKSVSGDASNSLTAREIWSKVKEGDLEFEEQFIPLSEHLEEVNGYIATTNRAVKWNEQLTERINSIQAKAEKGYKYHTNSVWCKDDYCWACKENITIIKTCKEIKNESEVERK